MYLTIYVFDNKYCLNQRKKQPQHNMCWTPLCANKHKLPIK